MAAPSTMGPPLSPREPRRSNRRPVATSSTTSNSKSSKSNSPGPEPPQPRASSSSRNRRVKDEHDDGFVQPAAAPKKSKRKSKEKPTPEAPLAPVPVIEDGAEDQEDDEGGVIRCVCGRQDGGNGGAEEEDDPSFWIQCETCKVWQHGQCVGVAQEELAPEHYHCEECRPDLHIDLLKRLRRSNGATHSTASRSSRSHSPHHAGFTAGNAAHQKDKVTKRRNTMNSRDAAYNDEIIKQVMDGKATLEALADGTSVGAPSIHPDDSIETDIVTNRKRKRSEPAPEADGVAAKRTRSVSSNSDLPMASILPDPPQSNGMHDDQTTDHPFLEPPAPISHKGGSRGKRNGKKGGSGGVEVGPDGKKQPNQYTYRRPGRGNASLSVNGTDKTLASPTPTPHEHSTRRNPHPVSRPHPISTPLPPLTTWGLPDYLAHLIELLPTDTPQPLQVAGVGEERGVKVKWPGKRMSLADMGKRVRSLMEWVGREQGLYQERFRRKDALEKAVAKEAKLGEGHLAAPRDQDTDVIMEAAEGIQNKETVAFDNEGSSSASGEPLSKIAEASTSTAFGKSPADYLSAPTAPEVVKAGSEGSTPKLDRTPNLLSDPIHEQEAGTGVDDDASSFPKPVTKQTTVQLMEELMSDLIAFQEKFGLQVKMKDRRANG
ncbi:hypothetical protein SISNIDRAFT_546578 [Sistotremastrum niveocremeum HHB9708]|uniref:Zinc finger PHD-type domain-containing protein n=2 Tax=Sistotremastraceae TaxID=3402574 RepID=A0A165A9R6_9AGAM|nr:hypothetical protein SISNIDRAFT_546578 [Sistotremastrum niveocremeum HHB9708]KZT42498.1 hypothetical protein SISSUDRAFT_1125654 [Sistotremastrum suecicum HHB10207 ss-3]